MFFALTATETGVKQAAQHFCCAACFETYYKQVRFFIT